MASLVRNTMMRRISTLSRSYSTQISWNNILSTAREIFDTCDPGFRKNACIITYYAKCHEKIRNYPTHEKRMVVGAVLEIVKHHPDTNPDDVFLLRCSSLPKVRHDKELTRDEVKSIVLNVIKTHPSVCSAKVTEEAEFVKDLGLSPSTLMLVIYNLERHFLLFIPKEEKSDLENRKISSCKDAIDYIYEHLDQRLPVEEYHRRKDSSWVLGR